MLVLVFAWNEYLLALFLSTANAQTMPLLVAAQNATRGPQWWYMSVLIVIMIIPVIVMAVVLERYISRGILEGREGLVALSSIRWRRSRNGIRDRHEQWFVFRWHRCGALRDRARR